ncbi:MAG: hypothetical protein WAK17_11745 [Candidatus Nitrosopolaris sp.]
MSDDRQTTVVADHIKNFPFQTLRERQSYVLNEIASGFASGYKYMKTIKDLANKSNKNPNNFKVILITYPNIAFESKNQSFIHSQN